MKKTLLVIVSTITLVCMCAQPFSAAQSQENGNGDQTTKVGDAPWPRRIANGETTILFYRPQIDKWEGGQIQGYAAVSVETSGSERPTYGQVYFTARASVNAETRQVTLDNFRMTSGNFPTAPDKTAAYLSTIQQAEGSAVETVPQDQLISDLAIAQAEHKTGSELRNDPPRIIFTTRPAVLVLIDGQPVLRQAGEGNLQRVINTRALMLFDQKTAAYYLSLMDGWVNAPTPEGPWTLSKDLPSGADQLKTKLASAGQVDLLNGDSAGQSDQAESGGRAPATTAPQGDEKREPLADRIKDGTFPTVYVSTVPAELLTVQGDPQFKPVPNTGLLYVANTGDQIFMNTANQNYYVLISGRWFTAASTDGPWKYVEGVDLPADFAKIPEGDPKASVLASTPGTPAAQEAAIENQIPQTAGVDRRQTRITVHYDGDPRFEAIPGTRLSYAVNSATPVIEIRPDSFRAVQDGVWFAASSPLGPWEVATSVPPEVYSIPVRSPIHHVTYVRIYGFTPDVVYDGYTPGYYGTVLEPDGCVVYGTGWYYPPYIGSYWIGWPWTYGLGAGFGWSPWAGWGFGFGSGFLFPFYSPWWGPFGFGWGFPRWGYALGGWGWRPGFGWGRGFGWGPRFGWGGLRAFNVYGRWGRSAFVGAHPGWAGGRFAENRGVGSGRGFRGRPGIDNTRGVAGNPRGVPNAASGNLRNGRLGNTPGQFNNPRGRLFDNSATSGSVNSANRRLNSTPRNSVQGSPWGGSGNTRSGRTFSAPMGGGSGGHMGGGGRGGGGGGGHHH